MPMAIGSNAEVQHLQSYYPPNIQNKVVLKSVSELQDAFIWIGNGTDIGFNAGKTVDLPVSPDTIIISM